MPGGETGLLLVRGRIRAAGTEAAPVTFTSGEVDPLPGDWHGIVVLDSSKKNLLEWCRIEAAVTGVTLEFSELVIRQTVVTRSQTGLAVHASHVIATGGGVTECADGITSADGDVDLSEVSISGTQRGITARGGSLFLAASGVTAVKGSAVAAKGARLHLEGTRIAGNGTGIELVGCRGDLTGTRIEDNLTLGLDVADSPLRMTGNRIAGNREGGIMVRSGRGVLWDNTIEANGGFDLVNAGIDEVMAPSNWWGTADPAAVRGRVRQRCLDGVCGALLVEPVLGAPPAAR
jgi:hypothetical protein